MTYFSHEEQKQTYRMFDQLVGSTYDMLENPEVAVELGPATLDLKYLVSNAVCPDFTEGKPVLPNYAKDEMSVVILPVNSEKADRVSEFIGPLFGSMAVSWESSDAYSKTYDLDLEGDFSRHYQNNFVPRDKSKMREKAIARTITTFSREPDESIITQRPVMLVRESLFTGDHDPASTGVHEFIHADDMLREGHLCNHIVFSGASELRAYNAGAISERASDKKMHELTQNLDRLRHEQIGDSFTPNDKLMQTMIDWKVLNLQEKQ